MDNIPINQHLRNMSIMLQMLMYPFEAESVAFWVAAMIGDDGGLDTSDYSFGYISGWSKDKEVSELKESLDLIKETADRISSNLGCKLKELQKELQTEVKEEQTESSAEIKEKNPDKFSKISVITILRLQVLSVRITIQQISERRINKWIMYLTAM